MDNNNILEESGDSEVFENWTFVDTDEAIEATLLNIEQFVEDVISSASDESLQEDAEDSIKPVETVEAEKISVPQNGTAHNGLTTDSDDGVSIITDSEPEELALPSNQYFNTENNCYLRRQSQASNDYFDKSDLSNDVPEDLGQKGDPKYVHLPNQKFNFLLNALIIVCIAAVFGLGIGHFVGLQEECGLTQSGQSSDISAIEATSLLHKLEAENERLKLELQQLQLDIQGKNQFMITQDSTDQFNDKQTVSDNGLLHWDVPQMDPDHGTEVADVEGAAGQALVDNLSKMSPMLDIGTTQDKEDLSTSTDESTEILQLQQVKDTSAEIVIQENSEVKQLSENQIYERDSLLPYSDDELEAFQTRYVNKPKKEKRRHESKEPKKTKPRQEKISEPEKRNPDQDKIPETDKGNTKKTSHSFFTKMEKELNDAINRMSDFSTNFVKSHNMKEHVAFSVAALSNTMQDMQTKIKILSESTAQHSVHAMEKVKKSVYKMVQKVKQTSESILQKNPSANSFSSKVMKGINNLKDGFMRKWSNLKGKMTQNFEGKPQEQNSFSSKQSHHSKKSKGYEEKKTKEFSNKPNQNSKPRKNVGDNLKNKPQYADKKTFDLKQKREKYATSHGQKYNAKNNNNMKYCGKSKFKLNAEKKSHHDQRRTKGNQCNVTDGGWVDRWSQGRAHRRRADQESDWVFERAKARQENRHDGKESWYQKRGKNRQQYRENIVHQGFAKSWNF